MVCCLIIFRLFFQFHCPLLFSFFFFAQLFFSPVFFSTYMGHTKEKEKWNIKLIDFSLSFASYAPLATVAKFAFHSCVLYNIICFWWIIKKEYWNEEKEEVLYGTGSRKIISALYQSKNFFREQLCIECEIWRFEICIMMQWEVLKDLWWIFNSFVVKCILLHFLQNILWW